MLEVVGFVGSQVLLVLLPCLVSSGIGALIFTGLGDWTGFKIQTLTIPGLPTAAVEWDDLLWVIPISVLAAIGAQLCRRLGLRAAEVTAAHAVAATTAGGLIVGVLGAAYTLITGRSVLDVLESGEAALPTLVSSPHSWPVATLILLLLFKGVAYGISLGSFRGGPTFPAVYLGAALGVSVGALPGNHCRDRHGDDGGNHLGPSAAGDLDRAGRTPARARGHQPASDHPAGSRGRDGHRRRTGRARPPPRAHHEARSRARPRADRTLTRRRT